MIHLHMNHPLPEIMHHILKDKLMLCPVDVVPDLWGQEAEENALLHYSMLYEDTIVSRLVPRDLLSSRNLFSPPFSRW
jgi:hypothetical protein